jgi:clan AA aspartic protease
VLGSFDNKSPCCQIKIWGVNKSNFHEGTAIIDTGFNGYLSIPSRVGFPLGLVLVGTQTSNMADGNTKTSLSCIGNIQIGERETLSEISVGSGTDILIGTQLLGQLGYTMDIDFKAETVELKPIPVKKAPPAPKPPSPEKKS